MTLTPSHVFALAGVQVSHVALRRAAEHACLAAAGKLTKIKPILADSRPSPQASSPLAASALGEPEAWYRRTCSHRPTILLFCVWQMLLYMALAPEQSTPMHLHPLPHPNPCPPLACLPAFPCSSTELTYKEGGPAAEARFEAGVAGFEARAFRGCGIFTSEPFEVSTTRTRCRCSRARRRSASSTS